MRKIGLQILVIGALSAVGAGALSAQMTSEDMARRAAKTPTIPYKAKKGLYPAVDEANADHAGLSFYALAQAKPRKRRF